jgi:hypothetical protein
VGRLEEAVREFDDVDIDDDAAFDTEDEATYVETGAEERRREEKGAEERRRKMGVRCVL